MELLPLKNIFVPEKTLRHAFWNDVLSIAMGIRVGKTTLC